jgi:hypothetical protein
MKMSKEIFAFAEILMRKLGTDPTIDGNNFPRVVAFKVRQEY